MADSKPKLPLHTLQENYPYISEQTLYDLQNVGANEQQLRRKNTECKKDIDKRLKGYTITDIPKYSSLHDIEAQRGRGYLRVAVIGASGSGKSATGNTLLQAKQFATSASATSQTDREQAALSNVYDALVHTVIDTPGSWSIPKREHVVDLYIFVINLASPRFNQQDLARIHQLRDYNNILSNKRCILLLTHAADALRDKPLTSYLEEIQGDPLHDLIIRDMEGWRVMAINNSRDTKYEENSQWKMIMSIVKKTDMEARYAHTPSGILLDCSAFLREYKYLVLGIGSFLLFVTLIGIIMAAVENAPPYKI